MSVNRGVETAIFGRWSWGHKILLMIFIISMLLLFVPRIHSDGRGYYAYVRSLVIDHDLDFSNEFYVFTDDPSGLPPRDVRTATGYIQNPWSVGPAVLWIPFFLLAHLSTSLLKLMGFSISLNGYSLLYVLTASLGSAFYAFLGILLIYDLSVFHFKLSRWASLLAAIAVWFASAFTMYMYREPAMVHTFSFFTVSLFLFIFFLFKEKGTSSTKWVYLGIIGGLMILVRWQTIFFLLLPLAHSISKVRELVKQREWKLLGQLGYGWIIFLAIIFLFFLPQIIVWRIIYGSYLLIPHDLLLPPGEAFMDWTSPHFWNVLFSTRHGLFTWTPVLIFALPGFVRWFRDDKVTALALAGALLLQVYINGGGKDWYGGASFGYRRLIEILPVFILSLAFWLDGFKTRSTIWLASLAAAGFIIWNLLFLVQYCRLLIPAMEELTFNQMFTQKFQLPLREIYLFFAAKYVKDLPAAYGSYSGRFYLSVLSRIVGLASLSFLVGICADRVSQLFQKLLDGDYKGKRQRIIA